MAKRRRTRIAIDAAAAANRVAAELGAEVRTARVRRRITQREVGRRIGLHGSRISQVERGGGASLALREWVALGIAVGRPFTARLQRDIDAEPIDAGHLRLQELVLRLGRAAGFSTRFELPATSGSYSSDVGLRDERRRRLVLVECWNTIGDIGAGVRASDRKRALAEAHAAATGGEGYVVATCWVVRATPVNRALVARYPHIFLARFPGSSTRWTAALTQGESPPSEPGLVWADVAATRLFAWRRRPVRLRPLG